MFLKISQHLTTMWTKVRGLLLGPPCKVCWKFQTY